MSSFISKVVNQDGIFYDFRLTKSLMTLYNSLFFEWIEQPNTKLGESISSYRVSFN